jgi:hypothetical protein
MHRLKIAVVVVYKAFVVGKAQFERYKNTYERYAVGSETIKGNFVRNFKPLALKDAFHVFE